jgi:tetratricopeptide (TPR) repeat protein
LSVNNLAFLYQSLGRYSEAEPLYKDAIEVSQRVLGKEHPQTLGSVTNLALLYQAQGRYGEADLLSKHALEHGSACLAGSIPIRLQASAMTPDC